MARPYGKEEGTFSTKVGSVGLMEKAFFVFMESSFLDLVTLTGFGEAISVSSRV